MILILYGPPGSGKNFVAELLARTCGFYFYDADLNLTGEMRQCLYEKKTFTQPMRDYFFGVVIDEMKSLVSDYPKLVMAQAISRRVNRKQLHLAFPAARFVHIDASAEIRMQRLAKRNDWVTPDWVDRLLQIQEPANPGHFHLDNSGNSHHLLQQFSLILR